MKLFGPVTTLKTAFILTFAFATGRAALASTEGCRNYLLGIRGNMGFATRFVSTSAYPSLRFLSDHQVQDQVVFPGAGYLSNFFSALVEYAPQRGPIVVLEEVKLVERLNLNREHLATSSSPAIPDRLSTFVLPQDKQNYFLSFSAISLPVTTATETCHASATGTFRTSLKASASVTDQIGKLIPDHTLTKAELYRHFSTIGLHYGPAFQRVEEISTSGDYLLGTISGRDDAGGLGTQDPALIDGALQVLAGIAFRPDFQSKDSAYLPVRFGLVQWNKLAQATPTYRVIAQTLSTGETTRRLKYRLTVVNEANEVVYFIDEGELFAIPRGR